MPNRFPTRALLRPALLLPFVSLACNNAPPVTTPDPPQVSIIVDEPSTVGTSLKLSISTSGCEQVQGLQLLDNDTLLKQVTYGGNPTPVVLQMSEIRYTSGIAAFLSLTARVTCSDGRTNVSQAQPATFFPVEEVVEPDNANSQVVTDAFVAEGSGANVVFIGCANDGNGRPYLFKVPKSNPAQPMQVEMPFACDSTTRITDRKPAGTGTRWVWTPDKGAFALDKDFTITGVSRVAADMVSVTADGNAFVYDEGSGGTPQTLRLLTPKAQLVSTWPTPLDGSSATGRNIPGIIIGEPVVRGDGYVAVALRKDDLGSSQTLIQVGLLRYSDGGWNSIIDLDSLPFSAPSPAMAFNPSGTIAYLATQGTKSAYIRACSLDKDGPCDSLGNRLWLSTDMQGTMAGLVPYANGTRLAAVATNQTWFLDTTSNATTSTPKPVLNKDQKALAPTGALVASLVQPGPGSVFYQFNSGVSSGQLTPYPVEIVATDAPEKGELYRYQVPGGSLYGAVDDAGVLWLRVGRKLVKPLSPDQYRQVR